MTLALLLAGSCIVLVLLALFSDILEGYQGEPNKGLVAGIFTVVFLAFATSSGITAWDAISMPKWPWWVMTVLLLAILIWWAIAGIERDIFPVPGWIVGIGLFGLLLVFLLQAINDNPYRVKEGTVVSHNFTPAHYQPMIINTGKSTIITQTYVPDDWAIKLRGSDGLEGWVHFDNNVFSSYPIGSEYP